MSIFSLLFYVGDAVLDLDGEGLGGDVFLGDFELNGYGFGVDGTCLVEDEVADTIENRFAFIAF